MQNSLLNKNLEIVQSTHIMERLTTLTSVSNLSYFIETNWKNRFFIFKNDEIAPGVFYRTWICDGCYIEAIIDNADFDHQSQSVRLNCYKFFPGTLFKEVEDFALQLRAHYVNA
ncbi:hypothetical protein HX773_24565 [Pantoea sp. B9002]|uniref:hypothetical protein n=1 Tax=Pantoea sp. B9002 TaxID=2726979 RepID=UPI0015A315AB|nr:hypothetical protein [Pantoea sp. B9002]NWA64075.1 hypothetical protein [Pantoea sp. B9002]